MSKLSLVLSTVTVMVLAACTSKTAVNAQATPAIAGGSSPTASAQDAPQGTGDLGGGNGLNGKGFEKYIVDVTQLPEYQKFLKPISDQLGKITNVDGTNSDVNKCGQDSIFEIIAQSKTWYIAPVNLKTIAKQNLGVDFFSDPVQQLAVQKDKEIWINVDDWNGMGEEEKAELILHEITEALYLFRFLSPVDFYSVGFFSCQQDHTTYQMSLEDLKKWLEISPDPDMAPEGKRDLNGDDYQMIRSATDYLFHKSATIKTTADMNNFYSLFKFDARLQIKSRTSNNDPFELPGFSYFKNTSFDGQCYSDGAGKSAMDCQLSTSADGQDLTFGSHADGNVIKKFKINSGYLDSQFKGSGTSPCPSGMGLCFPYQLPPEITEEQYKKLAVGDDFEAAVFWIKVAHFTADNYDKDGKEIKDTQTYYNIDSLILKHQKVITMTKGPAKDPDGKIIPDYTSITGQMITLDKPVFVFSVAQGKYIKVTASAKQFSIPPNGNFYYSYHEDPKPSETTAK